MRKPAYRQIGPTDRFAADLHFAHQSMVDRHGRPFESVEDMDRKMIAHWNSVIDDRTTVWFLGDFCFWKIPMDRMAWLFDQLRGRIKFLPGNHDTEFVRSLPWDEVLPDVTIAQVAHTKQIVVMSHYPLREWPHYWHGALHLHGHTHANLPSSSRSYDIGVDNMGFVPLTLAEIKQRMIALPDLSFDGVPATGQTTDDDGDSQGYKA